MAFSAGWRGYFALNDGTLRNISGFLTECGLDREAADLDTTTLGNQSHTRIGGLFDGSFSLSGKWDPTATTGPDAILSAALGTVIPFEYGPAGSTAGNVKYSGSALIQSYNVTTNVDGLAEFTANCNLSGAVTRGTF